MKRYFGLVLALSFLISANLFAENLMQIKIDNFSISVPEGWSVEYSNSAYIFVLYSPLEVNDTFRENANLSLEKLHAKRNEKQYLEAVQDILSLVYTDFELLEFGDNYHIISGSLNGIEVIQIQYVAIKNDIAYIMTYSSDPDNFARYFDVFESIQATFRY